MLTRYTMKKLAVIWFGLCAGVIGLMLLVTRGNTRDGHDDHEARTATFRTQNLRVDETSNLGAVNFVTNINGPTRQIIATPGGAYPYGELNLKTITGIGTPFPADVFVDVTRSSPTFDCTTSTQHSGAMALEVTSTRSAGAFDLTNTALELTAENAQVNYALHVLKGDVQFDGGGAVTQNGGSAFFAGAYLATGATTPLIAENTGTFALYISANPGPTDSIRSLAPDPSWNAQNATASTLKLWNDSALFTLSISGPALAALFRPDGIVTLTAGAFGAGSTTLVGTITGVGAVATTITYANAFPTRSRCFAQIIGATPQFITVANTSTQATFSCFAAVTGLAANCEDFNYECIGQ